MKQHHLLFSFLATFCLLVANSSYAQEFPGVISLAAYRETTAGQLKEINAKGLPETDGFFPFSVQDLEVSRGMVSGLDNSPVVYFTPLYRERELVAFVVGYPYKASVFNIYFKVIDRERPFSDLDVYRLNGEKLASIKFDEKGAGRMLLEPGASTQRSGILGWLSCVGECIGDVHHACNSNPKCAMLLFASNIGGSILGQGPVGSISIGMACGGACTSNPNLDLLPGY